LKLKGISVIVVAIGVIILFVLFPIKESGVTPSIIDSTNVVDNATIERESFVTDVPKHLDSAMTENNDEVDFYIDENGTKHYILDVKDVPMFEG